MAFWGVEVRPGRPYTHVYDKAHGRLRITQATLGSLGNGPAASKSVVQCNVGQGSPVLLCSMAPDKTESCHLELEFEEDDQVVFSVLGQRSVHLSGYYIGSSHSRGGDGDETDSYGEDIGAEDSVSFDSSCDEDEYESDFIDDDDVEMFHSSPKRKSSVVIEEIEEDDKPANGTSGRRRLRKKSQLVDSDDDNDPSQCQLLLKPTATIESEDEDGFPISSSLQKEAVDNVEENEKASIKTADDRKRKVDAISKHSEPSRNAPTASDITSETKDTFKKKKQKDNKTGDFAEIEQDVAEKDGKLKKKKKKDKTRKDKKSEVVDHATKDTEEGIIGGEKEVIDATSIDQEDPLEAEKSQDDDIEGKKKKNKRKMAKEEVTSNTEVIEEPRKDEIPNDNSLAKKAKKKKAKKGMSLDKDTRLEGSLNSLETQDKIDEPQKTRTFSNGLIIEELSMGKPDGKKASPGSKVSVNYIGKLKNGKIFDSNVGQKPFKFRLGVGHVIKGWDVGVAGMRIGDRRRLVIPPTMGYGNANVGKIPANSWLVFEVELVGVN